MRRSLRSILRAVAALPLMGLLGACTIATPLSGPNYAGGKALEEADIPQVIISLTEAQLPDDDDARDLFWDYVRKIDAELDQHPGLIASSKRFEIFGNKAWTLTVWRDEDSLKAFVNSETHKSAVRLVNQMVERGRFATFVIPSADLPLDWERAEQRLQAEGREMSKTLAHQQ